MINVPHNIHGYGNRYKKANLMGNKFICFPLKEMLADKMHSCCSSKTNLSMVEKRYILPQTDQRINRVFLSGPILPRE